MKRPLSATQEQYHMVMHAQPNSDTAEPASVEIEHVSTPPSGRADAAGTAAAFDNLTALARQVVGAKFAVLSITPESVLDLDIKSAAGLPPHVLAKAAGGLKNCPCRHVQETNAPLMIHDINDAIHTELHSSLCELEVTAYLGVPVYLSDGTPAGSLAVMEDSPRKWTDADLKTLEQLAHCVDDQLAFKQALHAAEEAEERAQEAADAREQFLAHMAHEIRTPLNGIMGSVDVLASMADYDDPNGDFTRMLQTVDQSTQGLLRILNDALDIAKIDAGKLELDETPFDLCELGNEVTKLFSVTAESKGIRLLCDWDHVEDGEMRFGDGFRLRQILNNLLSNAIKFTDEGDVRVTITGGQDDILLTVKDSGCGMTQAQMDSIFDAYTQADKTVARRKGGTGLGLSIVRNLVQLMDGQIAVSGEVGKGTRFDVRLPMPVHEFEPLPDLPTFSPEDVFIGARVLVADDSPVNRLVLGKLLNGLQAEVVMAENGKETMERAAEGGFDWLLIDINMPDMNGDQVVRALRESGILSNLAKPCRVVAVTANVFPEQIASYLDAGFDACLGKPLRRDDLVALAMQHQF
ncbi:hypothetical protein BXY66_0948 [Shimia isoporae]|uniref:histidine kinase n=1 Tax=Shimia isoporae TaxID=647720 RepID=A0A4R1NKR0_9RHOB|nr:GAF domain-containing hybrid sensor histidine kinase/response regulator [Shimia isoporae]TCL08907.1 hypothetical protein BXY66_0948 [Shimia isoporae]